MTSSSVCPTCGNQITPLTLLVCRESNVATRFGLTVKLTPHQAVILRALVDRHPLACSMEHLASKLWGAEEGPEYERNTIRVHLCRIRRALKPLGVGIPIRYETGYRLVLDDLPALECVA